jgi:triacylglycerol lipase
VTRWLIGAIAIVGVLGIAGCGGDDDDGAGGDSFPGTADYSVPTAELDSALACNGGEENLSSEGENEPVLLVHGTTVTREQNWGWNYWNALPDLGYEVCWVQMPDLGFGDIQTASEYVARAIEVMHDTTGEDVDVIGHSQGGIEPRWVIKWFPAGEFVDDYIALAAPNHGSSLAVAGDQASEALWQLRPDADLITALNAGDETPGPIDYTSVASETDELIQPVGTHELEGAANVLVQDLCPNRKVNHGGIVGDDVAYRLVIDALTNPGAADPDRVDVDCSRESFPGAGKPQYGPPPKGIDPHRVDAEPPLEPYAAG